MLYVNEKLNWKLHISYLAGKIARGVGIISKARNYFTNNCIVQLCNTCIVPYLMYCNQILGSTYKRQLTKRQLEGLQNKAVRILTGSFRKTSIEWMYNEYRILNLYEINIYLVGKFMFFMKAYLMHLTIFFTHDYTIHEYNTRSAQHLHIPLCVSNLTKIEIRYRGPIIWSNILKAKINPMCSEASFKIMLKKCLFNQMIKVWIMS